MNKRSHLFFLTILFGFLFFKTTLNAQTKSTLNQDVFSGKEWKLFYPKALESDTLLNFIIESLPEEVNQKGQWGHFIRFSNGEFSTRYAAPCGLDCFTEITGTYKIEKNQNITMNVQSIKRRKHCDKESEYEPFSLGTFQFKQNASGFEFIKLN